MLIFWPICSTKGMMTWKPGPHDLAELAEALKRVLEALRHGEERPRRDDDDREDQNQYD
jgi:hypothetical protein